MCTDAEIAPDFWLSLLSGTRPGGIITNKNRGWYAMERTTDNILISLFLPSANEVLHLSVGHSAHRGGTCPSACRDTPPGSPPPSRRPTGQAHNPFVGTPLPTSRRLLLRNAYWKAFLFHEFFSSDYDF